MADTARQTVWQGTTGDGSLDSNWSNGMPDDKQASATGDWSNTSVIFDGASTVSVASGLNDARAEGELTSPGSVNFVADDTVVLDGKTYIYKAAPSADGEVDVGVDVETSLENLRAAIILEQPIGGKYGSSMTVHPTVRSLLARPTQLVVVARDGGTDGNALASTVGGGNTGDSTWGGATLSGGTSGSGVTMQGSTIYLEEPWLGDIMTSADPWIVQGSPVFFIRHGAGTIYVSTTSVSRFILDSPNYALAAELTNENTLTEVEILRGRMNLIIGSGGAMPAAITVNDTFGQSENLSITTVTPQGSGVLMVNPGIVTTNGVDYDNIELHAGTITNVDGTVTTLRSSGQFIQKSTDTMTTARILGGTFDLTQGSGGKTVTNVYQSPAATFKRREGIDSFTLTEIGVQ